LNPVRSVLGIAAGLFYLSYGVGVIAVNTFAPVEPFHTLEQLRFQFFHRVASRINDTEGNRVSRCC